MKNYQFTLFIGLALLVADVRSASAQDQTVNGQFIVKGNSFVKYLAVEGNLFVGSPSAPKQLNVDGGVFLHNGIDVAGNAHFRNGFAVDGNADFLGQSHFKEVFIGTPSAPKTLNVDGSVLLHNGIGVTGDSRFTSVYIGTPGTPAQLNVDGNTFLHNQLLVDGNSYVKLDFGVDKNAKIVGDLFIGSPSKPSVLNVDANTYIHQNLIVDRTTVMGGRTLTNIAPALQEKYRLFVERGIVSEDYVIAPTGQWADYVFDDHYKRPSLQEVEKFIRKNKHLEGIPSATEVAENGYSLRDVNVTLLRKIEELTLYGIEYDKKVTEQDKQIALQQQQLEQLTVQLKQLKSTIEQLKKQ